MTEQYLDEQNVKRTATGGRIYELSEIDNATRTDWSGLHINYGSTPHKLTFKEKLIAFFS
jgi:hypothetical protein